MWVKFVVITKNAEHGSGIEVFQGVQLNVTTARMVSYNKVDKSIREVSQSSALGMITNSNLFLKTIVVMKKKVGEFSFCCVFR